MMKSIFELKTFDLFQKLQKKFTIRLDMLHKVIKGHSSPTPGQEYHKRFVLH
jgi:hypothetical protein